MRVEIIVETKQLPKGGFSRIEPEMIKRLSPTYPNVKVRVRKGENNSLEIFGKDKEKEHVGEVLEEMFNEADEWLNE